VEHLLAFVRSPGHQAIMRRRGEWFEPGRSATVLWWMEEGERPTFAEAMKRLEHYQKQGSTTEAFSFRERFPPPR
jgi:hypothetical protein